MDRPEISTGLAKGLNYTVAATGSLALMWTAVTAAQAQPSPTSPDSRFAAAFDSWSIGGGGGFNLFQTQATASDSYSVSDTFNQALHGEGGFGAIEAGRDVRVGNTVFGAYGDFHFGQKDASFSSSDSYASGSITLGNGGAVTGRAGIVVVPNLLFYGLAGWAWQQYTVDLNDSDPTPAIHGSHSGITNGPTVGVGAELLLRRFPNVSFKSEYRFAHYDGPSFAVSNGTESAAVDFDAINDHSVRFILSLKFPPTR